MLGGSITVIMYWLVKSEPESYAIETFQKDKKVIWDGVRNYTARNNLKSMILGDVCVFYRSVTKPAAIALCKVAQEYFQDPTTDLPAWVSVKLEFDSLLKKEVLLTDIKENPVLANMILIKQSRLSVQPLSEFEFEEIMRMSERL